jgi:hypothetical protein
MPPFRLKNCGNVEAGDEPASTGLLNSTGCAKACCSHNPSWRKLSVKRKRGEEPWRNPRFFHCPGLKPRVGEYGERGAKAPLFHGGAGGGRFLQGVGSFDSRSVATLPRAAQDDKE